jgi:xanthine dehydrogenase accessory factor
VLCFEWALGLDVLNFERELKMSATVYHHLQKLLDEGHTVAVATITDVKGSVPREVGAKMIIHPFGRHVGTVGGGCGEADVIRIGLDVIQDGEPRNVHVDLTEDISMQSLGVCGGIMNVFIEQWRQEENDANQVALTE